MSVPLDPRVLINYYLRKGWYDHVQRLCENILEKKGSDPTILFWRAFGIVLERSYSSAIRELENLKKSKDVELPCLHALIYAHNQCKHIDHEEIAQFELQVCMAEESATEHSLLLCATFFWHLKEHAKARKILEQLSGVNGRPGLAKDLAVQQRAIVLRGWVDLTVEPKTKRDADLREASINFFEQVKEYAFALQQQQNANWRFPPAEYLLLRVSTDLGIVVSFLFFFVAAKMPSFCWGLPSTTT